MCGFLGEISNFLLPKSRFLELLDLSKKRGPDQQGYWMDGMCQIGFNRLAILDVSQNGNQPVLSPSGRFALVLNGEVYNYKELQKNHSISDSHLRSGTDTEVLAHLLDQCSIFDFSAKLNGMFAIAVWDIVEKKLHLIRDFAGIKPLFFGLHTNGIVFASQFNQIFKHPDCNSLKLRPEIMKEFFGLGYMHAPNTVFENIFQVEAGQIVSWNLHTQTITKSFYYKWETSLENDETDLKTVQLFETNFQKVIASQIRADVPIGTFLSSGIDSTLVTAFAQREVPEIKAFTFGINDEKLDESEKAAQYAKKLRVKQVVETCNEKDILAIIDAHFNEMSEPFGDASSVPTYLITKKAKTHATVMLSGDGGDELFWGYPRFIKSVQQAFWFKLPLWFRKLIIPFFRRINPKLSSALDVINTFSNWILYKQIHFSHLDIFIPNQSFSEEILSTYNLTNFNSKSDILLYLKQNEFNAHLQRVLKKVDLMSMANSLEVRVPFLDKDLIKFSNTINPQLCNKHQQPKWLLKRYLRTFFDQSEINLEKKGFSVPVEKWLRNELKTDFFKTVIDVPFYGQEFIDQKVFLQNTTDFFDGKNNINSWGIWHMYAWQKWALNNELINGIK